MSEIRVTERALLRSIINGTIDQEALVKYAEKRLAQIDKRNTTARNRAAKKRAEGDALTEAIYDVLTDEPMSRQDVLEILAPDHPEASIGKVSYRLVSMAKQGRILRQEATISGDEKNRKVAVYTRLTF